MEVRDSESISEVDREAEEHEEAAGVELAGTEEEEDDAEGSRRPCERRGRCCWPVAGLTIRSLLDTSTDFSYSEPSLGWRKSTATQQHKQQA